MKFFQILLLPPVVPRHFVLDCSFVPNLCVLLAVVVHYYLLMVIGQPVLLFRTGDTANFKASLFMHVVVCSQQGELLSRTHVIVQVIFKKKLIQISKNL